jgi:CheY-like chemotaxis protein
MAQVGLLEDNARIAKLCVTMLQYAGHQVTLYTRAHECLTALLPQPVAYESRYRAAQATEPLILPVDLLILDLHLPDIDGMEVLYALRAHPHTRTLPLIFCTAASTSEIAHALHIAPHASFLEKPFTYQQLVSAITGALTPCPRSEAR